MVYKSIISAIEGGNVERVSFRSNKSFVFCLVLFFSIFCSFNFFPFITAEVQPVIGVFILLYGVVYFSTTLKINYPSLFILIFFLALLPSLVLGISVKAVNGVSYLFYLIGPAIFCYFYKYFYLLTRSHLKFFIVIFFIISLLQALSPETINSIINPYFEMLIKRARFGFYGDMRGVGILYSEPAHAAKYIFVLTVLLISFKLTPFFFSELNSGETKSSFWLALMLFICILLNKSASLYGTYVLLMFFYLFFYVIKPTPIRLIIILSSIPVLAGLIYIGALLELYTYLPERLASLVSSYNSVKDNFTLNDLQYFGSIRLISVIAGYAGPFIQPLGVGIGNGGTEIFNIMQVVGFDLNSINFLTKQDVEFLKPNAYGAQIAIEAGVLGLLAIIVFLIYFIFCIRVKTKIECFYSSLLALSLFQILFFSTTTVTAPWMTLALSLYSLKRLKS